MDNKYEDIHLKSPQEAALLIANIDLKNSYLAHTIREIEEAISHIRKQHYRVVTRVREGITKSGSVFKERCCHILLDSLRECVDEDMKDRKIRLTLAHELGHIIRNINKLKNFEDIDEKTYTAEEEDYAWKFAYYLTDIKSEGHKDNIQRRCKNFIYESGQLKQELISIIEKQIRDICEIIEKKRKEGVSASALKDLCDQKQKTEDVLNSIQNSL